MSIEKVQRDGGVVWRVRWREGDRNRARTLGRKRDAEGFDAEMRRRKRAGDMVALDAGKETLGDFAKEWFRVYAIPNLTPRTLDNYAGTWDRHVLPRLGGFALRELNAEVLQGFASDLARARVGPGARRRAFTVLSSVLTQAKAWRRIGSNPMQDVKWPSGNRARSVRPLPPETVERLRTRLLEADRLRDATLVSVPAYAGVRPGEALALAWEHVGDRVLLVERSDADGRLATTKTGQARSVSLVAPLAADLAEWRLACGRPEDRALVFPNRHGDPWAESDWRNWRKRIYVPAAKLAILDSELRRRSVEPDDELWEAATPDAIAGAIERWDRDRLESLRDLILDGGIKAPWRLTPPPRPYDLRHGCASLMIGAGRSVVEVAAELGHRPTMTLDTYSHAFAELKDCEPVSVEEQIRRARNGDVPVSYLFPDGESNRLREIPDHA